jgi:hypothetical protein
MIASLSGIAVEYGEIPCHAALVLVISSSSASWDRSSVLLTTVRDRVFRAKRINSVANGFATLPRPSRVLCSSAILPVVVTGGGTMNRRFCRISSLFVMCIASIANCGGAQAQQGKVLDLTEFTAEADRRAGVLNDGSTDTSRRTKKADKNLAQMNRMSDQIEQYDPDHANTKKWREYYNGEYAKFVADRANDDTAFILFRDFIKSSRAFLKLHNHFSTVAAYNKLDEALKMADRWESYVINQWPNRDARPRRPAEAIKGPPPASVQGRPVLRHERLTESGSIGVGQARIVQYRFTNQDPFNRVWFYVKLSEADDNGNPVTRPDLTISPAGWSDKQMLGPNSPPLVLTWRVVPLTARQYAVGLQLEETNYMPKR